MTGGATNHQRATAVHEAGHAVIGRALGLLCGQASVVADGDSAGHSIAAGPYEVAQRWEDRGKYRDHASVLLGRLIYLVAGAEAEELIVGTCAGGDGSDRQDCYETLTQFHLPPVDPDDAAAVDQYFGRLRRHTRALVRRHENTIRAVAETLQKRGTLSADELDAMMPFPPRPEPVFDPMRAVLLAEPTA